MRVAPGPHGADLFNAIAGINYWPLPPVPLPVLPLVPLPDPLLLDPPLLGLLDVPLPEGLVLPEEVPLEPPLPVDGAGA